jgi:hypothetical protein
MKRDRGDAHRGDDGSCVARSNYVSFSLLGNGHRGECLFELSSTPVAISTDTYLPSHDRNLPVGSRMTSAIGFSGSDWKETG